MIAIIPARVSSKRLLNKNFKEFFGKPMISWVLDEIRKSEIFDDIVISTDAEVKEYEDVVGKVINHIFFGNVKVVERKNPRYEDTVDDVCMEVLEQYPNHDWFCCVYPTAYAVTWKDLIKGFGKYSRCMLNGQRDLDNGGFYHMKVDEFLTTKRIILHDPYDIEMYDINTMEDFMNAKLHAVTLPCGRYK